MINFFKKTTRRKCDLQLLSVHIPKTAGTSFRMILNDAYGKENVCRLDYNSKKNKVTVNEQPYLEHALPDSYPIIHGHFIPRDVYAKFNIDPAIPVITWLRHPVEQVISHYYYQVQLFQEATIDKGVDVIRLQRTLLEFAADPQIRNRSTRQLQGKHIDDYFYVGIVEQFDQDVQEIATLLGWKNIKRYTENVTKMPRDPKVITDEVKAQIAEWNSTDMELYNHVLSRKSKESVS